MNGMFYEEAPAVDIRQYDNYYEPDILPIYEAVGWTAYTQYPDLLKAAFMCSLLTYVAYVDGRIVGVARAVGDELTVVLIQDILVLPEYQGRGIGKMLLQAMLTRYQRVRQVFVVTDDTEKTVNFYQSMGMKPVESVGCRCFMKA